MYFPLNNELDYSLLSLDLRKEKVNELLDKYDCEIVHHLENFQSVNLSQNDRTSEYDVITKDLEKVADYLLYMDNKEQREKMKEENLLLNKRQSEHRKKKEFLTENFSFVEESKKLINKNVKVYGKIKVYEKDRKEHQELMETGKMITLLKKKIISKTDSQGNPLSKEQIKKLRWYLIEIGKDEVAIKEQLKKYITFKNIQPSIPFYNLNHFSFANIYHVKSLFENYQEIKESTNDKTENDFKILLFDFEKLVNLSITEPILKKVYDLKLQGFYQKDIAKEIFLQFKIKITQQRISQIVDEIIPSLIVEEYKQLYEEWIYTFIKKGNYKFCLSCKENKLATTKYFHKDNKTKDNLKLTCKECRKKK